MSESAQADFAWFQRRIHSLWTGGSVRRAEEGGLPAAVFAALVLQQQLIQES